MINNNQYFPYHLNDAWQRHWRRPDRLCASWTDKKVNNRYITPKNWLTENAVIKIKMSLSLCHKPFEDTLYSSKRTNACCLCLDQANITVMFLRVNPTDIQPFILHDVEFRNYSFVPECRHFRKSVSLIFLSYTIREGQGMPAGPLGHISTDLTSYLSG